jgi:MOSC domain-containing protein YiiM
MTGRIVQINVSAGGVPKRPVPAGRVTRAGIEGDGHRNRVLHGGPERALCLYSVERIEALQAEGHPVEPGSLGENLTVAGLDWPRVRPADVFRIGETVLIQITRFTRPCANVRRAFLDGAYARVSEERHPGWSRVYARVLAPGTIAAGDRLERLEPGVAAPPNPRAAACAEADP